MNHSTRKPTKAEQARLHAIHCLPCLACAYEIQRGNITEQPFQTEADHCVKNGYRKHSGGHMATIPLEKWHHRGIVLNGYTTSQMTAEYGPSKALDPDAFYERYGSWDILQIMTDELIASNRYE